MWCADCEDIKSYIHQETRFFLFCPTLETNTKLTRLCEGLDFNVLQHHSHCLSVLVDVYSVELFLMALFGELHGPEKANTKIATTSGAAELDFESIGKLVTADVFINRYKSLWIVDSIKAHKYETWFQPIVTAESLNQDVPAIYAHEALFRLRDQHDAIIPPAYVFNTASQSDLLFSLDLTARRSAIEHAAVARMGTKIFVNFDPSSIYDPAYCLRSTAAAIAEAGLKNEDVVFEVTETHKAKNIAHLKGILQFYRNAGFQVALDDVGAGWSGLNLLNSLMPDFMKIDMELIRDIDTIKSQQTLVKHLIASARDNGIKVIAEGIETREEASCLQDLGVDFMQGYYFGRPALKAALPSRDVA